MKVMDLMNKLLEIVSDNPDGPNLDVILYIPIANEYPMPLEDNKTKVYTTLYEANDGYIVDLKLLEQFNDLPPESAKMTAVIELDL